jgi:hypothetical protein
MLHPDKPLRSLIGGGRTNNYASPTEKLDKVSAMYLVVATILSASILAIIISVKKAITETETLRTTAVAKT